MVLLLDFKLSINCQMEDTQKYLNGILEKRMGSVPSFSKYNGSITRIPKQEQNIESMPSLFKKKHQTVYKAPTVYESQYRSTQINESKFRSKKQTENQRVQYMTISKRISTKEDQVFVPAIDVSKYRRTEQTKPPPTNSREQFMGMSKKNDRVEEMQRVQEQAIDRRGSQGGRMRKTIFGSNREKK